MKEQFRPEAETRKIHSKDEFELCYLRHQYFRRTQKNPSEQEMAPYQRIIKTQAQNTFFTYKNLFHSVGFDVEDIMSVGMVQLVSYLGLFAVESSEQKQAAFEVLYRKKFSVGPDEQDVRNQNLAIFTKFLKQRMEDVVRVCRQKARNVKGMITDEFHVFYGPKKPNKDVETLLKRYSELGYKKLDLAAFRTIRKKAGERHSCFKYQETWYICVPIRHKLLSIEDLDGANLNPHDNLHNMTPEDIFLQIEENRAFEAKKHEFESSTPEQRAKVIREFIRKNRRNGSFKGELETAKKMLVLLEK